MPIYDEGYRRYEARGALRQVRFWPITREAVRLILARRLFVLAMATAWIPFIGFAIYLYAVSQVPGFRRVAPLDASLFARFLTWQTWMAFLPTIIGGSGLIANDLRTGAILVYLSRPLTRRDYILGKLLVPFGLNLAVTLLPGLVLYGMAVALAPEALLNWDKASIGPAVVAQSLVISIVLSLVTLGVSALSRSGAVAGISVVALLVGLEAVRGLMALLTRRPEIDGLSLLQDLQVVGNLLFGIGQGTNTLPAVYPVLVLAAATVASLAIVRARVRAVEIVR